MLMNLHQSAVMTTDSWSWIKLIISPSVGVDTVSADSVCAKCWYLHTDLLSAWEDASVTLNCIDLTFDMFQQQVK